LSTYPNILSVEMLRVKADKGKVKSKKAKGPRVKRMAQLREARVNIANKITVARREGKPPA
jgi:hypothetical protein